MEENKKKKSKLQEEADSIEQSIDDLVNDEDIFLDAVDPEKVDEALPALEAKPKKSFSEKLVAAETKARKTINTLLEFYLTQSMIDDEEYIKAKRDINTAGLKSLLFQMEAGEHALVKLLDTIEDGNIAPRMFEVLATLQKSMMDIVKAQTTMMITVEEEAKKIRYDHEIYRGITSGNDDDDGEKASSGSSIDTSGSVKVRGAKDLMMQLEAEEDDVEDLTEESTEENKGVEGEQSE